MSAHVLRIENLSKTFPGQTALENVSIDVAAGEVHALVGQNGSGKSTLIKVLAGYHQPDPGTGTASAGGKPLTLGDAQAAADAGIRFVHQDLGLVGTLNAVDNIAFTAGYQTGRGGRIRWKAEVERHPQCARRPRTRRHRSQGACRLAGAVAPHDDRHRPRPDRLGRRCQPADP